MKNKKLLTLLTLACTSATYALADLDLANLGPNKPGCALGVVDGSELVLESYKGLASIRYDVPIIANTSFDIGSISKHITAAVFFQLEKQGLISRDDLLSKYYPDGPSWFKNITLAQLITHRSGIPDYLNDEEFSAQLLPMLGADAALIGGLVFGKPMTNAIVVDTVLKGLSSLTEPYVLPEGTSRYSNTGYLLLAHVLEMAAKKPFPLLAEEIIFTPNGMTHSYLSGFSTAQSKNTATGYEKSADGYQALHDNLTSYGDGSVVTTVQDFAKWMSVLLNSTNETSPWFGFLQDPKQQQLPKLGDAFYGNGLVISDYSGWFYEHAGKSIDRMESNFWVSPENAVGYVQMCNSAASIQARNYEVIRWVLSSRKDH